MCKKYLGMQMLPYEWGFIAHPNTIYFDIHPANSLFELAFIFITMSRHIYELNIVNCDVKNKANLTNIVPSRS